MSNPGFRAITFDELRDAYAEQVRGLIDGGADLLLIETIFDTLNAKAAIHAILDETEARGIRVPIMISGTITDLSGRLLSGQTPAALLEFGAPCRAVFDRPQLRARREGDARARRRAVARRRYARLRLPECRSAERVRAYDETPEFMARLLGEFARGARQHRRRLLRHDACSTSAPLPTPWTDWPPRKIPEIEPRCACPGLEPFALTPEIPFVNIGERTNVTGSAKFRKLITAGDYEAALAIAREQVENGAQIIDVNMDEGLLDSERRWSRFLNLIASEPDIARVPVMIDSSKFA